MVGSTPEMGEHNGEILTNPLGLPEEDIAQLYQEEIISKKNLYGVPAAL